jgi:uncharacterized membrane protein YfcA
MGGGALMTPALISLGLARPIIAVGSIPGVWIGSKMSAVFLERILQPVLPTTLFFLSYKLV